MTVPARHRIVLLALVLAVAPPLLFAPAAVADDDDHLEARRLLQRGEILPLLRILDLVRAQVPGDIIEVELDCDDDDGTWDYEAKVLTAAGVVRKITLDARDGTVLKIKDD